MPLIKLGPGLSGIYGDPDNSLPSTVAIGPVDYTVKEDAERVHEARGFTGDGCWAYTDKFKSCMMLDPGMSEARKRETLLHECIHALLYEWHVDLGELKEEALVESLGDAFLALIRDNPQLITYLTEGKNDQRNQGTTTCFGCGAGLVPGRVYADQEP